MSAPARIREELSIIVVDDMKFNCAFIRKSLQDEGYNDVRVAVSAREALALLAERPADVLLADWVMPEMDGLELTDRVRQIDEEQGRYTCILLLTARDDIASVIEAFDRGVDDYLTKPPIKQELAARVYAAGRIANLQNGLLDAMETLRRGYEVRITIDQLTGLGNRLDAERRFTELLGMVESRGGAACCGFFSLNQIETLRTQHGAAVYDEILKSIATRLRRAVRPNDLVARLSDSEFVLGMYYQDEDHVKAKSFKRIMQSINLRPVKTSRGFVTVNGTMAVSCSRKGNLYERAEQLMEAAAKRVEEARAQGSVEVTL
ncbi:MAG: response regulator [Gammaproteobacteria bacterium]|nr:response regulator [Gammaproteobacteria bacterium]